MTLDERQVPADTDHSLVERLCRYRGLTSILSSDELRSVTSPATTGAGLRRITSEQMFERVRPYLKEYGITRVANVTHLDRLGLPVHTAYKPNGLSLASGSGKGLTDADSAAGAAMEAIEQSMWERHRLDVVRCSLRDLERQGVPVADPAQLARLQGNIWNANQFIDWSTMTDLVTGDEVWVPADVVGIPLHRRTWIASDLGTFTTSTNGLASGSDLAEATLSALFEVLERDAITLAKLNPRTPDLDLGAVLAVAGPDVTRLLETITAKGMVLKVHDATNEACLPTYIATIYDALHPGTGVFMGYGNAFDPQRALVRAITEAAQSRGLILAGARDDLYATTRRAATRASSQVPIPDAGGDHPVAHPSVDPGDVAAALDLLCTAAARCGTPQVLVRRFTEPGDPAQVVRVVVPGLEGYPFENVALGPRARAVVEARS